MMEGVSILSFVFSIVIGLCSGGVIIAIIFMIIKGVKGHGGKVNSNQDAATTESDESTDAKFTAEEINQKIKNIFANLAEKSAAQPKEKQELKHVVKDRRCKNCGASLAEDKNGKLHCPYCQSKYF